MQTAYDFIIKTSYGVFMSNHRIERRHGLAFSTTASLPSYHGNACQQTSRSPHESDGLPHGVLQKEDNADSYTVENAKAVRGVKEVGRSAEVVPDKDENSGVATGRKVDLHRGDTKQSEINMEHYLDQEKPDEKL
jgi:hypothetical protein